MSELVSVVIPTRNRCRRLHEAIASVRQQTGVDIEIIVVDDASSDGTPEAMAILAVEESRLRYIRNETPLGGGGARNAGANAAQGDFIAFLDDDDQFLPRKLEKQLAALQTHPSAAATFCSFWVCNGEHRPYAKKLRAPDDRQELLRANMLGGASVCMVRLEAFKAVGGFDPRLRAGQDWDLWLKLHYQGELTVSDEPLVRYNLHNDGQITGNFRSEYRGRRRIHLRYSGEMRPAIRCYSLCELMFYRRFLFGSTPLNRIRGLFETLFSAQGLDKLRFAWRAFRYLRQGLLAKDRT